MGKKYCDYMDEISPDVLYERLLSFGLFSKNLPPIFDSRSFAELCKNHNPGFIDKSYDYVRFNFMRNVNIPRELGIPVPMAYEKLCMILKKNWLHIQQHFHKQTDLQDYIISRIHLQLKDDEDALFLMNYDDWRNGGSPKDDLPIGKKYIVEADISNCFQSIYTHSIPWALIGKDEAKKNRRNSEWYNKIDVACQMVKYKETHGLLIGPHASNLISEIILTAVDNELYKKGWKYIRHIDDYMCYVKSEEQAGIFIRELSKELEKYDLHLNYKKVCIHKLPYSGIPNWVRQLNEFDLLTSVGKVDYFIVRSFFNLAIELMNSNKENAAVLSYAIKMLSKKSLTDSAKKYCWKMGMQLCFIYPYLFPLMDDYVFKAFGTPIADIQSFADRAFYDGHENENYEECCYSVLFSLKYEFDICHIEDSNIDVIDNCLYKLFVLLYYKKRQNKSKLDEIFQHALRLKKYDMDRHWLFTYEALEEKDLEDDWKKLKHAKISFLKSNFQYSMNLKR